LGGGLHGCCAALALAERGAAVAWGIVIDKVAKEWIGLIAYLLMGETDAVFPRP
jgi:succinate dehydrogenase/fumarate reductase flavoprotein subunit